MAVSFYMDVHVPYPITLGLRLRGVEVLTAQEDSGDELEDDELLHRATKLNRILVSFDRDLLEEANKRQRTGEFFCGVVYGHQMRISIGQCVRDLELLAKASEPADFENRIEYLPLR
jgi:predicted nuclease of predicted toxin-antitoxin system